ncbi:alpha-1,3/alpha-1,6-mannosyltransferase [Apostasia shenzhenica]|uniref:Alpha-1,3/alpha-1,6-mannosyltransferase n=1 Tax=Apostasia shenzhenica TaxID=1088818 RepID=A0A2I0A184_9ASPA|nr:alpha-1,3/alpha-1,6-mannosyltransferase [Apostasia shenzhenica]
MGKPATGWISIQKRKPLLLLLLAVLSVSAAGFLFLRGSLDSCDCSRFGGSDSMPTSVALVRAGDPSSCASNEQNPLRFMRSKLVLLVSHELSLSGGPLLLLELAFLLRNVGAQVVWITYQKPAGENEVIYSLEHRMLNRAVTGKWLEIVLKDHHSKVLSKILWWIHEMRGHYFKLDYVKHLPFVAGAMIDSNTTAEYWKNRTHERLGLFVDFPSAWALPSGNSVGVVAEARGECFGRITIEAMAFQLPVLGTAAGGTIEIVVDGSTGLLHPVGKEGMAPLAENIVKLATHAERRLSMGQTGYWRVKERFMEHHMAERIASVLKQVLQKSRERLH